VSAAAKTLKDILTPRQFELAMLVAGGRNNQACGKALGISPLTVKNMLREVFDRASVWSRLELACRYAWEWRAGTYPAAPYPLHGQENLTRRKGWNTNPQFAASSACEISSHSTIRHESSLRDFCSA
jgi:DNA-binding CsgD family transcriptional regulator